MKNYQAPPKTKKKAYIQSAGLLFILLVLPLGSWYYLSSGLSYQRSARAELKDYGDTPAFKFADQNGHIITADSLKDRLVLASFFRPNASENDARFEVLKALHEQFDDRQMVWFLQYLLPADDGQNVDPKAFMKENEFRDLGQIFYLNGEDQEVMKVLSEGFKMPVAGLAKNEEGRIDFEPQFPSDLKDYPYLVLIGKKGKVRSYCDARDKGQVKRLVEHMALAMPREK